MKTRKASLLLVAAVTALIFLGSAPMRVVSAETVVCGSLDAGNLGSLLSPCDAPNDFILFPEWNDAVEQLYSTVGIGELVRIYDPVFETVQTEFGTTVRSVRSFSRFEPLATCSACAVAPAPITNAQYVSDVTLPDGSNVKAGQSLKKTWRVRNIGNTQWPANTELVFVSGERMGAPVAVKLGEVVRQSGEVNVSVNLQAPTKLGAHSATFRLRVPGGDVFGPRLSIKIKVAAPVAATPTPKPLPARHISVVIRNEMITYLHVGGDNQNGVYTEFATGDKKATKLSLETPKHWWQGTLVIKVIGVRTGAHTCVIEDLKITTAGDTTPVILDPTSNTCTGDAGSAPIANREQFELLYSIVMSEEDSIELLNKFDDAVDSTECVREFFSKWNPNGRLSTAVKVIKLGVACKGILEEQVNLILAPYKQEVHVSSW